MTPRFRYPSDLAEYVRERWPAQRPLRLPFETFCQALSVAYHASLTSEETRPTRFRLLLTPPDDLPENGVPNQGVLRLAFDHLRAVTPEELRQLAPAAPFETSLIGAYPYDGKLRIWGIAHSGPAWLAPAWGGRQVVPNWTYDPIIHVRGPGLVAVRCAGKLVGALERGALVDGTVDVFESEWLPALFVREREEIQREHADRQARVASPTAVSQQLIGRVTQHMLRRAIQLVLGSRHGGLLLVVDAPKGAPPASLAGLNVKYRFDQSEPPRRYRTLLFQLLDGLAASTSSPQVDWPDFARDTSPELEKLEQAIFEISRVFASLAAIDGAVVLDKRWAVIGFGAEVSSEIPPPTRIWRALDTEAKQREESSTDDVGTRHRAAYRFVRQHPTGLAVVVSADGGVSVVANRDGEVVSWEQTVSR
ncbi:MAG TPA: hypothetical protein VMT03_24870 [Polyangia bacterium]|nr:hypothetical protein [Polyangia bacterium]